MVNGYLFASRQVLMIKPGAACQDWERKMLPIAIQPGRSKEVEEMPYREFLLISL